MPGAGVVHSISFTLPVTTPILLFFRGRCEEAIAYYKAKLGAEVLMMMRFKDNPEAAGHLLQTFAASHCRSRARPSAALRPCCVQGRTHLRHDCR